MYIIHIWVRCPQQLAEILPDDLEQAAVVVEAQVSQALLELFGGVIVEDVSLRCIPAEQKETYRRMQE
jgi:hypothetical protein